MKSDTKNTSNEIDTTTQAELFDKATALFQKREFARARELFDRAARGPAVEMAHAAAMHLRMCDRRLGSAQPELRTPEDKYNYGVALMNRGELEQAERHLRSAVAADGDADHFHYALALCAGLRGDLETSADHLRRAIELRPANRIAARNDAEFHALMSNPQLREIVYS